MRRNSYNTIEYGGKWSGSKSTHCTSDELVLGREDIAYVMKALRRGNGKDREFAKKMLDTLLPHVHCDCCGRRILTADHDPSHLLHGKCLCYKCWFIMTDIEHCLEMPSCGYSKHPLEGLKWTQKAREKWCPRNINYLVNERTYDRCLKKYEELYGKKDKLHAKRRQNCGVSQEVRKARNEEDDMDKAE